MAAGSATPVGFVGTVAILESQLGVFEFPLPLADLPLQFELTQVYD